MSKDVKIEPYGRWPSPLQPETVAHQALSFKDLCVDQGSIYWSESRPCQNAGVVVMSYQRDHSLCELTSSQHQVGSAVHGYGGGAFVVKDKKLFFADSKTNGVFYKNLDTDQEVKQILNASDAQYADFTVGPHPSFLYCLRKRGGKNKNDSVTEIVRINLKNNRVDVMAHGADFYANLCLSPDGTKVAWLQWDHPWMPWDRNELWVADLTKDHDFINAKQLFSSHQEAFYQPSWNSKNQLFVCSDRTGYWNLYCVMHDELFILFQKKADFGRALWTLGTRCYSFLSHHEIILCYCEQGIWHTGYFNTVTNLFSEINNGLTCLHNIASDEICTAFLGGHPFLSLSVCGAKNTDLKNLKIIRTSAEYELSCEFISKPEMIKFPTRDHKAAFVIYYPPCHPHYCAPPDTSPPLILKVHGGPTSSADYLLNPKALFYTSRGYAYAEINYRGSTGYGKDFRKSLTGKWGSQDVEDCADCILYLCEKGKADQKKLILSGSSSGGTTVLKSLACFDIYACASCSYGISDFISMRNHIHKFEAFYDETLLGASFETERHVYSKKSPLFVAHKIRSPVIFFHGDCDVVVDVTQTYQMAQALAKRSVYHEVYIFQDEGHGFKKAENIAAVLRKEFEFFKKFIEKE